MSDSCIIFQIKILLTPRHMLIIIVCVYIDLISSGSPVYAVNRLDMIFSAGRNRTILGLVSTSDKENVEKIYLIINNFLFTFVAFAIVIICTVLMVISLQNRAKWRQSSTAALPTGVTARHMRTAKMVVMVSTLFIVGFIPLSTVSLIMALLPGFNIYGKYMNIGMIISGIVMLTESVNSSANIFIYFHMSVTYRETFSKMCYICK